MEILLLIPILCMFILLIFIFSSAVSGVQDELGKTEKFLDEWKEDMKEYERKKSIEADKKVTNDWPIKAVNK